MIAGVQIYGVVGVVGVFTGRGGTAREAALREGGGFGNNIAKRKASRGRRHCERDGFSDSIAWKPLFSVAASLFHAGEALATALQGRAGQDRGRSELVMPSIGRICP